MYVASGDYGAFGRRLAYAQTSVDLARVAVALERYRLAHGEFPESLDALAPQFMEKIPHDIIGGQPLHYRRTDDGQFVLYSVGWNETDDGGVVGFTKARRHRWTFDKGDWVWRYPQKNENRMKNEETFSAGAVFAIFFVSSFCLLHFLSVSIRVHLWFNQFVNITNLNPDTDIGASAWLVEIDEHRILLDAGMHPKREGRDGLPLFGKAGKQRRGRDCDFALPSRSRRLAAGGVAGIFPRRTC